MVTLDSSEVVADWRMHAVAVDDLVLHVHRAGRPDRPALVLVHGGADGDGIVTEDVAARAAELNPLVRSIGIADAGHNIHRKQFDRFIDVTRSFLLNTDQASQPAVCVGFPVNRSSEFPTQTCGDGGGSGGGRGGGGNGGGG